MKVEMLDCKKLFTDSISRVILTEEYIKENDIQKSWLEEVEDENG